MENLVTIEDFILLMQGDLKNEYKHFHSYLQASFLLVGPERLTVGAWLSGQADEELSHVRQFASKIRAFGHIPMTDFDSPPILTTWQDALKYALVIEEEVLNNYHLRLSQIEK